MTFTPTPPTEPGRYYWRKDVDQDYEVLRVGKFYGVIGVMVGTKSFPIHAIGGEWGGRVPAPGTTWTVTEFDAFLEHASRKVSFMNVFGDLRSMIDDPQDGIAAVTERNKKEG